MQNTNIQLKSLNKMEQPLREMIELNKKAFANFYFNPMGLTQIKKPEEFMEKSIEMFVENGHETLDYLHHLFFIWEKHAFNLSDMARDKTEELLGKTQSLTQNLMGTGLQKAAKSISSKKTGVSKLASRSTAARSGMKAASQSLKKSNALKSKKSQRSSALRSLKHK